MTPNSKPDEDFPWWLVILAATGAWLFYEVRASDVYSQAMATLAKGIWLTILVTLVAYAMACALGLALAMAGLSRFVVEFFRQPDAQFVSEGNPLGLAWQMGGYGLTMGQLLTLPMIVAGAWFIARARAA